MSFADTFFSTYPEFTGKIEANVVEGLKIRVCKIYPVLKDGIEDPYLTATCMVVAHYIVKFGYVGIDTSGGATGIITSANVGDVSINYQEKPINDMYEDFFATSLYGTEFLAWLRSISGVLYVN